MSEKPMKQKLLQYLSGVDNIHVSKKMIQVTLHCYLCSVWHGVLPSKSRPNNWQSSTRWNISEQDKIPLTIVTIIAKNVFNTSRHHEKWYIISTYLFLALSSWCVGVSPSGSSSTCTTFVWSPIPRLWSHSLTLKTIIYKSLQQYKRSEVALGLQM